VLVENVAALLSRGLGTVLGDLAEIGYDAEWRCIQAADVGFPHYRDRVWILAYPAESGRTEVLAQIALACQARSRENRKRFQLRRTRSGGARWIPDEVVCSITDGVSDHLDGLAAAGNAIVPEIAAACLNAIKESAKCRMTI
jgi:DNA (cytosine-5)-methyltransferase 1